MKQHLRARRKRHGSKHRRDEDLKAEYAVDGLRGRGRIKRLRKLECRRENNGAVQDGESSPFDLILELSRKPEYAVDGLRWRGCRKLEYRRENRKGWRWLETNGAAQDGVQHCEDPCVSSPSLPFDLILEHILARLSVRQLCQLRCVCKAWNVVLATGGGKLLPDKGKESWFLMRSQFKDKQAGTRSLAAFSSHGGCAAPFRVPIAGGKLSSYLGGSDWSHLGDWWEFPSMHFIASAGGLICTLVRAVYAGTLLDIIVFNCFTGSVKVLPRPPSRDFSLHHLYFRMHMAVDDRDPFHYNVMIADSLRKGHADSEPKFEVFDSRSEGWKVGSSTMIKSSGLRVPNGHLFDFIYHPSDGTMDVLAYHAAQDAWSAVQVPFVIDDPRPPIEHWLGCWSDPCFLKYGGRFFMGCLLLKDKPVGFEVWELCFTSLETATLVEVARTPEHLYQIQPDRCLDWSLKAEGCVFCMCVEEVNEGKSPPLVYDMAQNLWYVVPGEVGVNCILVHRPRPSMFLYG